MPSTPPEPSRRANDQTALIEAGLITAGVEPAGLDPAIIAAASPAAGPGGGAPAGAYRDLLRGGLAPLTIGLTLSMTLVAFEIIGSATAMPAVLEDIGGAEFYGWALAAPLAGSLMAAPFGGRFADRYGAFGPLIASLSLFALGLVGAALAPTMTTVAAGRFVQGLGAGSLTTLQLVVVARTYPVDLRPKMLAVLSAAFVIPGLVGPFVAALIAEHAGWRWVYGGILPVLVLTGALLLPPVFRRVRGARPVGVGDVVGDEAPVRWWAPITLSLGVAVSVVVLSDGGGPALVVGTASLVAIAVGMRGTLPTGAFGPRRLPAVAAGSALLASFAYLTFEALLPLLLRDIRGLSLLLASLPLTAAAIFWTGGSWVMARLRPDQRPRAAVGGNLLEVVGIALGLTLLVDSVPFWIAYPATAVASFGMGLAFTIDQSVAVEWAGAGREGAAGASVQMSNLLGGALGTGLSAVVLAWLSPDLHRAMAVSFTVLIVAALTGAFVSRRLPDRRPAPAVVPGPTIGA